MSDSFTNRKRTTEELVFKKVFKEKIVKPMCTDWEFFEHSPQTKLTYSGEKHT